VNIGSVLIKAWVYTLILNTFRSPNFYFLLLLTSLIQITFASAERVGTEDRLEGAGLCVKTPKKDSANVLLALRKNGIPASHDSENDFVCAEQIVGSLSFLVPFGLESWAEKTLVKSGFKTVFYHHTTAGGGYYAKTRMETDIIFSQEPNSANLELIKTEVDCKLRNRLGNHFDEIFKASCLKTDVLYPVGLCYKYIVGGHLSTSKGIRASDLHAYLDGGFWFSVRFMIVLSYIDDYTDNDLRKLGKKARADLVTLSTKFAKYPSNKNPKRDLYRNIEHFNKGVAEEDVDADIASRLSDILFNKGKLSCH